MDGFSFYVDTYPAEILGGVRDALEEKKLIRAPKCIFKPSKNLLRIMIKSLLHFGNEDQEPFLLKFGLLVDPNRYLKLYDANDSENL